MYDTCTHAYVKHVSHTGNRIYAHIYTYTHCLLRFSKLLERNTVKESVGTRRIFPGDDELRTQESHGGRITVPARLSVCSPPALRWSVSPRAGGGRMPGRVVSTMRVLHSELLPLPETRFERVGRLLESNKGVRTTDTRAVPGQTAAEGARSGHGPGAFLASSLASVLTDGRSRPRRGGRRLPRVSVCVAGSDRGQTESRRCTRGHGRAPPRGSQRFVGRWR